AQNLGIRRSLLSRRSTLRSRCANRWAARGVRRYMGHVIHCQWY
ncbi:MAG: hypothetical protein BJ554DRAFT_5844, partial [Olpidium bornovanus]